MHPKVKLFLLERDRAYARGDTGIIRSMDAELRRLGVVDTATLNNPTGKRRRAVRTVPGSETTILEEEQRSKSGRPKLARCEHENIADRCEVCNPELTAH